jgi:tRNA(fMet)-specific endonuclease VapC
MRYMLDTNICIYIIKAKPMKVLKKLRTFDISDIVISAITHSELEYGVTKSGQQKKNSEALKKFLSPFEIVPYDSKAAEIYGKIRTTLEKKGAPVGAMDTLIGAHAQSIPVTLVTNNLKEFRRIPGLRVENWAN